MLNTLGIAALLALATGSAAAQKKLAAGFQKVALTSLPTYPTKPIRLIVPFPPGGGTDAIARTLAQHLTDTLGYAVVVDNRAGGGGTIGAETGVRAAADGYTLVMVSGSYATNAALFKLPYDPVNDITPIALIAEAGFIVALHPGVPAKTIKELIAFAKASPGSLNYASTGTGGITHLATELFNMMAGIKMTHVPYKGTGPSTVDLLSGQVQLKFSAVPSMVQHMKTGRVRGIAITTLKRNATLPDMPTVAETVPGYRANTWYGCWGPKNLPQDIVARWNLEIAKVVNTPEMHKRISLLDPIVAPPERLRELLREEVPKWTRVVKAANVQMVQ